MNILVISDAIAPQQGIGPIRWTKLSKYLKINHPDEAEVTILTCKKNYTDASKWRYVKDELLEKDMVYFDHYEAVPITIGLNITNYYKGRVIGSTEHFVSSKDTINHGYKTRLKVQLRTWYENYYNNLLFVYVWNYIKNKAGNYDVVISTYNPIWPTMVASKIKKENPRIFWLADFRDTCGRDDIDMAGYAPWHKKYTMRHCSIANAVTQVDQYIDTCTPKFLPHYRIPNGFDPSEFLPPSPPAHFDLVLTGSVYGKRQDFGVVFKVLNELVDQGHIEKRDVSVIYAGRNSGEVKKIAEMANGLDFLDNRGLLPRKDAKNLQSNSAILIQASYNLKDDRDTWTGKMYEYMMAKKPIVYVINGDLPYSWVSGEIEKIGGVAYETVRGSEMYGQLKKYILDKYIEWKTTGNVTISRDDEYVDQFSYQKLAEKIWNIINNTLDKEDRVLI